MTAQHKYIVPLFTNAFSSLEDAKWNVEIGFIPSEARKYLAQGEKIYHFVGDKLHSETPIHVDEHGNITFGRTRKVM